MSYTKLLPPLLQNGLVAPSPMKPVEPPCPRGYDANANYDYQARIIGHFTKSCDEFD